VVLHPHPVIHPEVFLHPHPVIYPATADLTVMIFLTTIVHQIAIQPAVIQDITILKEFGILIKN
jgi:hypothetical protein